MPDQSEPEKTPATADDIKAAVEARAAERLRAADADGRLEALARGITDGLRPLSGAVDELLQG